MQIRSQFQHAWATAVEIVGTIMRQALKSNQGESDCLRFFALMSSAIAHIENTGTVENTTTDKFRLIYELNEIAERLDAVRRLQHYGMAPNILENPSAQGSHFLLLQLDTAENQLKVKGYKSSQLSLASGEYLDAEKAIGGSLSKDAVLVSVDSLAALKRAYPNYFLDTNMFVELVEGALSGRLS